MLKAVQLSVLLLCGIQTISLPTALAAEQEQSDLTFQAGHPSLQGWLLPESIPTPANNPLTEAKIELGQRLFFDVRLSANNQVSCATCHSPQQGWSDGLPLSSALNGGPLRRASPTIINMAYNSVYMWDGRAPDLETQALMPITAPDEMGMDLVRLVNVVSGDESYKKSFGESFPQADGAHTITSEKIAQAIASFVRTITRRDSPFDRWVQGDATAMTQQQIDGFKLFLDADKGNCAACHDGPNFTDNSFHNLGLKVNSKSEQDLGRYEIIPLKLMQGAFKTPTLRNVSQTAPYFHDGSAETLEAVMEHYIDGGTPNPVLAPDMKSLDLSQKESDAIIAFLEALTSPAPVDGP